MYTRTAYRNTNTNVYIGGCAYDSTTWDWHDILKSCNVHATSEWNEGVSHYQVFVMREHISPQATRVEVAT